MPQATLGRIVQYTLNEGDADTIRANREDAGVHANSANAGDVFPATIVRVWNSTYINAQVHLDGPDVYWKTSAGEGTGPGTYAWPTLDTSDQDDETDSGDQDEDDDEDTDDEDEADDES
jgi:hypothetical protein